MRKASEAEQQRVLEDHELTEIGNFVYGPAPGNSPQVEFQQKFGSKKRTRTMPSSFSLGQQPPGSGHRSEADRREFGSATPGAFDDKMHDVDDDQIIEEEGDEFSDAHGH